MVKRGLFLGGVLSILLGIGIYNNIYAAGTFFSVDVDNTILELTIPSSPAVINLTPTTSTSAFGTATINFSAATNNQTGYTITMTPQSSDNDNLYSLIRTALVGDEETYRRIDPLAQTNPASTGYTEDSFSPNAWGYRILSNSNYYGIDENNPAVSHPAWVTEDPTNGTNHSLTVAAKVDAATVSGSYATTLVFTATTNTTMPKDTIKFNANGGTGTMNDIIIMAGTSERLPANAFTAPAGKQFLGWCTSATGDGLSYDNQATYTAENVGKNRTITLYAIWAPEGFPISDNPPGTTGTTLQRAYEIAYTAAGKGMYIPISVDPVTSAITYREATSASDYEGIPARDNRFAMQDMTSNICASATVFRSEAHVVDTRDWYSYWILKAEDGQCWMTQNLNFYINGETLTHTTTDIGWDEASTRTSWTPPTGAITVNEYGLGWDIVGTPISREPNNTVHRASGSPLNHYNILDETDSSLHLFGTLAECVAGGYTEEHCQHSHLGIFYNWAAAIMENDAANILSTVPRGSVAKAPDSICPSHWKLPTSTEYNTLMVSTRGIGQTYDLRSIKRAPYYFVGPWSGGQRSWTNEAFYAGYSADAYITSEDGMYVTYWYLGGYEVTVRCMAR